MKMQREMFALAAAVVPIYLDWSTGLRIHSMDSVDGSATQDRNSFSCLWVQ